MKTNQNMVRRMGKFEVVQRTKDGMFYATGLAKQWNAATGQRKDAPDFLRLSATKEYVEAIEGENENTEIPVFRNSRGKQRCSSRQQAARGLLR